MQIKEKYILEFQRLYKKVFDKKISYDEAYSQCMDMVILGNIVYSPFSKEELKCLKKLDEERNKHN